MRLTSTIALNRIDKERDYKQLSKPAITFLISSSYFSSHVGALVVGAAVVVFGARQGQFARQLRLRETQFSLHD